MSIADLGSLGEFIGSIAVVITLIFLTLQMRQSTSTLQTSISQSYLDRWVGTYDHLINDDTLAAIFAKEPETLEELSEIEVVKVSSFFHMLMRQTHFMYYQYRKGKLDQELWEQIYAGALDTFRVPIFRYIWELRDVTYLPEMIQLVDRIIAEATQLQAE